MKIEKRVTYVIPKDDRVKASKVVERLMCRLKESGKYTYHSEGTDYIIVKSSEFTTEREIDGEQQTV